MQAFGVDLNLSPLPLFFVFVQQVFVQGENVLAFVIVDEVDFLQRVLHVFFFDRGSLANFVDGDLGRILFRVGAVVVIGIGSVLSLNQLSQDGVRPVGPVGQQAQVTERLLRASSLAFELRQLVAELDQKFSESLALKIFIFLIVFLKIIQLKILVHTW